MKDLQARTCRLSKRNLTVNGVSDVHDFHAWKVCSHITVARLYACLDPEDKVIRTAVRKELESKLNESGVQHVTIQLEEICCIPSHGHEVSEKQSKFQCG